MLGDPGAGYPSMLYPNLTYTVTSDPEDHSANITIVNAFPDVELTSSAHLLLGPMKINNTFSIFSLTLPIISLSDSDNILGFMT
jgi:osomolarity two-component system, sensor histidine kinase SLN1